MEENMIAISALQHYAFCPRQFSLIHVEQVWHENYFTADGRLLHERVDSGEIEQRGNMRYERSVSVVSHQYKIQGKMDLLEIDSNHEPHRFFPVEYKRGKPKIEDWDKIQLCAQALCIEEMRSTEVAEGAIWYWEVRHREPVNIDQALRNSTINVITAARWLLEEGKTPLPIADQSRCKACSLVDICQPKVFRKDHSKNYLENLFLENKIIG
jgi:CRISPR-associated exonuclease Cas4